MDLTQLIGRQIDDEATAQWLRGIAETPDLCEAESRSTLEWPRHGLMLNLTPAGQVSAVYLRPAPQAVPAPQQLTFTLSRAEVLARLGPPSLSKPTTTGTFGVPGWDRYDTAHHSLHIQYRSDEAAIELITVLFPQPLPAGESHPRDRR